VLSLLSKVLSSVFKDAEVVSLSEVLTPAPHPVKHVTAIAVARAKIPDLFLNIK
jgi:hypothetical protein